MPLESATYINGLNASNPTGADTKAEGDDHIRLIKSAVKATFPNLTGAVTADQTELNILDGATLSTAELNLLDGVTASTAELNLLDGVTATTTEINYIDGVTSPIQTQFSGVQVQLSGKADITGETYTGTHDFSGATAITAPTKSPGSTGNDVATVDYANALAFSSVLPGYTGNALKVLRVNAGETSAEWALGLPIATSNEGKTLALDGSASTAWIDLPDTWANWTIITSNGGTFTVADGRSKIRAYTFGAGGNGASVVSGGGGGGGGCTFGTIPCKPGDVFTFEKVSTTAALKKGSTTYLLANDGASTSTSTGGAGGAAGTVGSGLGITASGAYDGGAGGSTYGGGGSSGSPLGNGRNGGSSVGGGGGWGVAGNTYGGGGVGALAATVNTLAGPYYFRTESCSRDWSNAFTDPLMIPCNWTPSTPNYGALDSTGSRSGPSGGAGQGGGGNYSLGHGGKGGLGGGGGASTASTYYSGDGGFGGGGGSGGNGTNAGNGGYGGGGGGAYSASAGTGGSACVIIFW